MHLSGCICIMWKEKPLRYESNIHQKSSHTLQKTIQSSPLNQCKFKNSLSLGHSHLASYDCTDALNAKNE